MSSRGWLRGWLSLRAKRSSVNVGTTCSPGALQLGPDNGVHIRLEGVGSSGSLWRRGYGRHGTIETFVRLSGRGRLGQGLWGRPFEIVLLVERRGIIEEVRLLLADFEPTDRIEVRTFGLLRHLHYGTRDEDKSDQLKYPRY